MTESTDRKIKYWVCWMAGGYVGASEVVLTRPVRGMRDVELMANLIGKKRGLDNVMITNWRRFEDQECD